MAPGSRTCTRVVSHEGGVPVATHDDVAGQEQADAAVGLKRLMAEGRGTGAHEYS